MLKKADRNATRQKRHIRLRKDLAGTPGKPRLNVFRSLKHIYAQIIDDQSGATLVSASTMDKELKSKIEFGGNIEAATTVGKAIAERAKAKGITQVVFDRGGYLYHGRVAAVAAAAREAGLQF